MAMTIKTNNVPRDLLSGWELTREERAELDYIAGVDDEELWAEQTNNFFRYKGHIEALDQYVRICPQGSSGGGFAHYDHTGELSAWHGIKADSFFSALVVRYVDGNERVVVGLATS